MPRDPRPYVTYPVGYTEHPRLHLLSDSAFRVFHSMNDYSREYGLDGKFSIVMARKKWPRKALDELVRGIDDRPLVVLADDAYFLRSYEEHQFTVADIEKMREKKARAGAAGGRAKAAAKQTLGEELAGATEKGQQNVAESKSESKLTTDVTKDIESGQLLDGSIPDSDSEIFLAKMKRAGVKNIEAVRQLLHETVGEPVSARGALELVLAITSKAKRVVSDADAYVAVACRTTPAEVQQAYFDLDIGGVA